MSRKISTALTKNTSAKETLFTVPTKQTAYWELLFISNTGANNKTATVYWYDASKNVEIAIINKSFSAGESLEWGGDGKYVAMAAGDEIRVAIQDNLTSFAFIVSLNLDKQLTTQYEDY
jgi:hypothetical protein